MQICHPFYRDSFLKTKYRYPYDIYINKIKRNRNNYKVLKWHKNILDWILKLVSQTIKKHHDITEPFHPKLILQLIIVIIIIYTYNHVDRFTTGVVYKSLLMLSIQTFWKY